MEFVTLVTAPRELRTEEDLRVEGGWFGADLLPREVSGLHSTEPSATQYMYM